jgi:hypothetical protein
VIYNFPDDFLLKTGGSATLGYDIDTSHSEAFSFIRTGGADGDTVIEIAEKRRISDKFACGMYGMKDLKQFQTIAEEVLAEPAAGNEYYMSDLFVRLLQKHETVCAVRFQNILIILT